MAINSSHIKIISEQISRIYKTSKKNKEYAWSQLHGDGSDRIFYRIVQPCGTSCIAVFPSPTLEKAMQEAESCYLIGKHLASKAVSVPQILAYDHASGAVFFEDLGNQNLYDIVNSCSKSEQLTLYRQVLEYLVVFQIDGYKGFKKEYCWDTQCYDRDLMIDRESHYFTDQFCRRLLQLKGLPDLLEQDFENLADRITHEDSSFLIHRDFQSRNVMVSGNTIKIIDYQGARLGPLGYDLAALLNDPYVELPDESKEQLLFYYLKLLSAKISLDHHHFIKGYYHIALQRNLQVLGAYAYLFCVRKKVFFKQFIGPALKTLTGLLTGPLSGRYPTLLSVVKQIELQYFKDNPLK